MKWRALCPPFFLPVVYPGYRWFWCRRGGSACLLLCYGLVQGVADSWVMDRPPGIFGCVGIRNGGGLLPFKSRVVCLSLSATRVSRHGGRIPLRNIGKTEV